MAISAVHVVDLASFDAGGEINHRLAALVIDVSPSQAEKLFHAVRRGERATFVETMDIQTLHDLVVAATTEAGGLRG